MGGEFSETSSFTSTNAVSLNQWYHVVAVRKTSPTKQGTFYINGAQDSGGWQSWIYGTGSYYPLAIGTTEPICGGGGNFFNGYLDEVRAYNRALSQEEITELYNMGR